MDVFRTLTDNLLTFTNGLSQGIGTVLQANYVLASAILSLFERMLSTVGDVVNVVVSAIEDFESFLWEVLWCITLVCDYVTSVVYSIHCCFLSLLSLIGSSLGSILRCASALFENVAFLVDVLLGSLIYVVTIFVGAVVILLQCIPYCIVETVRCIAACLSWALLASRTSLLRAKDNLFAFCDVRHIFRRIPIDAYVGLVTVIVFYFLCTKTALGSYLSPKNVSRATGRAFRSTMRATLRRARSLKGLSYRYLNRARSWLAGANHPEEEEKPNEALDEPQTSIGNRKGSKKKTKREVDDLKKELEMQKERNLCIICQDRPKSVILLPCRHMCLCEACCSELLDRRSTCPLCRTSILSPIQVFT